MRYLWPVLVFLLTGFSASAGKVTRLSAPNFTFTIAEPEGWTLDLTTVAQIAHLALYPSGTSWRESNEVIFGRFLPRQAEETVKDFLLEDEERLLIECPFAEIKPIKIESKGPHLFEKRSYACPGLQTEIVTVAKLPSYFALFSLSVKDGPQSEAGIAALSEVLKEFTWEEHPRRRFRNRQIPPPELNPPPG
jgi:hypothetical protein